MTHRFSIVVPLIGDTIEFEDTLASVLRHRPPRSQVIVVHNGMYEDPHRLHEVELTSIEGRPHLARFFNQSLKVADGQFVAFVRPGVEIDENWQIAVEDAFDNQQVGCVAPVLVNANRPNRIVAAGVQTDAFKNRQLAAAKQRMTQRILGSIRPLGPTQWFAIYRRDLLEAIGRQDHRFDEAYLDVEIAQAMQTLGFKCSFQPDVVGYLESEYPIVKESKTPHGYSAQRSLQRYSKGGLLQKLTACARELVRAPFNPPWLQHMFQRFSAGPHLHEDQQHYDRLVAARSRKAWELVEQGSVETQYQPVRRAA